MRKLLYMTAVLLVLSSCEGLNPPVLPQKDKFVVPQGVMLETSKLFGIWSAEFSSGSTNDNYFEQSYRVEFQDVNDAEAILSHWYTDSSSELADSVRNMEYTYEYMETEVLLKPKAAYAAAGASALRGVYLGEDRMLLVAESANVADSVCTLVRTGDPAPAVTGVDKTLPRPGEKVTITGRNLQFVDKVFLPVKGGEVEADILVAGSKQMTIAVPEAVYRAGSVRCQSTSAGENCYSPAYMFCHDCVFFHNFISDGYSSPYKGSEFEFSISAMNTLKSGVANYASDNLPDGHPLSGMTQISHPDSLLSFFGAEPIQWPQAGSTDDKKGYLRFSSGDRFQYVLDNCNGLLTSRTPCSEVAIQMDIYVVTDGKPVWNTGYLSYRLNKDQNSLTSSVLANVAMWEKDSPMSFEDGWKTISIPLSAFAATADASMSTLGGLISSQKSSNLQTILTLVNYPLDSMHPSQEVQGFQFNIADIRLVPYETPSNTKIQK